MSPLIGERKGAWFPEKPKWLKGEETGIMTAHQIDSFTKATTMEGQETTLITDYVLRLCVLLLFGVNFLACGKKKHINIEKEFDLSHLYTCEVFAVTGAKIGSKLRIWSIYGGHGQVMRTKQPHLACFLR
ncbi:uncharacterized protein LOC132045577 isoform X1 [Lycium ferocissimum]|uniref:uncharacterized protein LOC132045577 isoform X1 n=1 Tax=Lycium ferocissimum TaxID=112874 RepID=UPI002814F03A|nr:uncharacterized protein LOC132045577 isoform X1 [Lycium ferocissimum]